MEQRNLVLSMKYTPEETTLQQEVFHKLKGQALEHIRRGNRAGFIAFEVPVDGETLTNLQDSYRLELPRGTVSFPMDIRTLLRVNEPEDLVEVLDYTGKIINIANMW